MRNLKWLLCILVPTAPISSPAAAQTGRIYVSNEGSGDVTIIDQATFEVVGRVEVGLRPRGIHLLCASNEDAGTATITNLRPGEVVATLVVGIEPEGVAVSPDRR